MVGRLTTGPGGLAPESERLAGLRLLRVNADGDGSPFRATRRLKKAANFLRRNGVTRVLVPPDFDRWSILAAAGLEPVATTPFFQALAPMLVLSFLTARGIPPQDATVALRGERVTGALYAAAIGLCPQVAHLVVEAEWGGTELVATLGLRLGLAPLPAGFRGDVALCFSQGFVRPGEPALELYAGGDWGRFVLVTDGITVPQDCAQLPFLALLWEVGYLTGEGVEVYVGETT